MAHDLEALRGQLHAHLADLARELLGEPSESDRHELRWGRNGSLALVIGGEKAGRWHDHEAQEGGDVFRLIQRARSCDFTTALAWAAEWAGVAREPLPPPERGHPSTAELARRLAGEMRPISGTDAFRYLAETRGIDPAALDRLPRESVGYHPRVRHKSGHTGPALVLVGRDGAGSVQFGHVVFLAGPKKATVSPAKLSFGPVTGAAVQLLGVGEASAVVLTEGPEDGLTAWSVTGATTWICCGVANFSKVPLPAGVAVILAAQNDPPGSPAAKTLDKAARALRERGHGVTVVRPPAGVKDINDVLRRDGAEAVRTVFSTKSAPEGGELADLTAAAPWSDGLILNKEGEPRPILANVIRALRGDAAWAGVLRFDEFASRIVLSAPPPWHGRSEAPWVERELTDVDLFRVTEWVQRASIPAPAAIIGQALETVARDAAFHPVRDYLDGLAWDGRARLDGWLTVYAGAEAGPYIAAVGSKFLIGAVARVFAPGCKLDTMLVLEGPQGLKKSSALRALAGSKWFTDHLPDLSNKDALIQIQGVWLCEISEMSALDRAEVRRIKQFLASSVDRYRVPHGKIAQDFPRQAVFAGTINPENGYLKDATGARRFWPVRCRPVTADGKIDAAGIERDRDQLWAEAVARYRAGESWWMEGPELEGLANVETEERYAGDARDDEIAKFISDKSSVSVAEVISEALKITDRSRWSQADQNMVARALTAMGWERRRVGSISPDGKSRPWRYFPPGSGGSAPTDDPSQSTHTGTPTGTPNCSINSMAVPVSQSVPVVSNFVGGKSEN